MARTAALREYSALPLQSSIANTESDNASAETGGHAPEPSSDSLTLAPGPEDGIENSAGTDAGGTELYRERPDPKAPGLWRRLGIPGSLILIPGSAMILLVMVALCWLWVEAALARRGQDPRTPWIQLFSRNWTTGTITVCTAVIRAIVALQASLATALLAAIILESVGTPLLHGPFYSIVRALTASPITLWFQSASIPKGILSRSVYALLVAEVLVTIACQLLSTMLVSDLGNATVIGLDVSLNVTTLNQDASNPTLQLLQSPPALSWTFAEATGSHSLSEDSDSTGNTYRAFIPLHQDYRTRLRNSRLPVPILDTHVSCLRPELRNITYSQTTLSGDVYIDKGSEPITFTFGCKIPDVSYSYAGGTSLCYLVTAPKRVGYDHRNQPLDGFNLSDPNQQESPVFLLIDVVSTAEFDRLDIGSNRSASWPNGIWHNHGPWAVASNSPGPDAVRITACSAYFGYKTLTVTMLSSWDPREPKIVWDPKARKYDTRASRIQLGASSAKKNYRQRGILVMDHPPGWESEDKMTRNNDSGYFWNSIDVSFPIENKGERYGPLNGGVLLAKATPGTHTNGGLVVHPAHVDLFQDILSDTRSPALALQALLTRLCQMAYYERLERTDTTVPATLSFSTSVLLPVRWTGFSLAVALVTTHLVLVLVITRLFLRLTRFSLIGNSWQAVSQAISEDTRPILEKAEAMTDKEVEAWAKRQSLNLARLAGLGHRQNGRKALGLLEEKRD